MQVCQPLTQTLFMRQFNRYHPRWQTGFQQITEQRKQRRKYGGQLLMAINRYVSDGVCQ
ncbi:hypothetical protein D3C85_1736990 [compost metagenome]